MYTDEEIERWYLGLPFEKSDRGGIRSLEQNRRKVTGSALSDEEIERLYLGLPARAA